MLALAEWLENLEMANNDCTLNPIPGTIGQFDGSMPPIKMILLLIVMLDNTSCSTRNGPIWAILSRYNVRNLVVLPRFALLCSVVLSTYLDSC